MITDSRNPIGFSASDNHNLGVNSSGGDLGAFLTVPGVGALVFNIGRRLNGNVADPATGMSHDEVTAQKYAAGKREEAYAKAHSTEPTGTALLMKQAAEKVDYDLLVAAERQSRGLPPENGPDDDDGRGQGGGGGGPTRPGPKPTTPSGSSRSTEPHHGSYSPTTGITEIGQPPIPMSFESGGMFSGAPAQNPAYNRAGLTASSAKKPSAADAAKANKSMAAAASAAKQPTPGLLLKTVISAQDKALNTALGSPLTNKSVTRAMLGQATGGAPVASAAKALGKVLSLAAGGR